jgi:hypothetical protein
MKIAPPQPSSFDLRGPAIGKATLKGGIDHE